MAVTDIGPAIYALIGIWSLVGLVFYLWYLWSLSRLFPRLGLPAGAGWIPVWNQWQLVQRAGLPGWLVLFALVPGLAVIAYIVSIVAMHRLNGEQGKGAGYTVIGALLPPVWAMLLTTAADDRALASESRGTAGGAGTAATRFAEAGQPQRVWGTDTEAGAGRHTPVAPGAPQPPPAWGPAQSSGAWADAPPQQPAAPHDVLASGHASEHAAVSRQTAAGDSELGQQEVYGADWGFSKTTEGAYERLAAEDAPRAAPGVLGGGARPQPFSWPEAPQAAPVEPPPTPSGALTAEAQATSEGFVHAPIPEMPDYVPAPHQETEPVGNQESSSAREVADGSVPDGHTDADAHVVAAHMTGAPEPEVTSAGASALEAAEPSMTGDTDESDEAEVQKPVSSPTSADAFAGVLGTIFDVARQTPGVAPQETGRSAEDPAPERQPASPHVVTRAAPPVVPVVPVVPAAAGAPTPTPTLTPTPAAPTATSSARSSEADAAVTPAAATPAPLIAAPVPGRPGVQTPEHDAELRSESVIDTAGTQRGDDIDDQTIVVRRRSRWALVTDDGTSYELLGDDVVVGRKPAEIGDATVLQLADPTRTVSKSHARLRRVEDAWTVEDLHSTNGVALIRDGEAELLPAGEQYGVTELVIIGTLQVRLTRIG